ncbi:MAG TPA: hypothetical protein VMM76_00985 [Pirellulaceae bacterium]|nr:hypothetical protein [Pirellulaceae bacterium]
MKCFVWSLVGTVLFLGLFVSLKFAPQPYNGGWRFLLLLLIIPYLLIDIPLNRRQAQIRAEEAHTGDQPMT